MAKSIEKHMKIIKVKRILHSELFAHNIYNNFIDLANDGSVQHNKKEILRLLNCDDFIGFLVYNNNILIGYLVGEIKTLQDSRIVYYISYIYVSTVYRGKKIGSRLIDLVIKECNDIGLKFVVLMCNTSDKMVTTFYKKKGFTLDPLLKRGNKHDVFVLYLW